LIESSTTLNSVRYPLVGRYGLSRGPSIIEVITEKDASTMVSLQPRRSCAMSSDQKSLRQTYTLGQALRLSLLRTTCQTIPRSKWSYRFNSTSAPSPSSDLATKQDPHETARIRLKPLIDDFEAPIDYAVAYGSGVIHQANRPGSGEV